MDITYNIPMLHVPEEMNINQFDSDVIRNMYIIMFQKQVASGRRTSTVSQAAAIRAIRRLVSKRFQKGKWTIVNIITNYPLINAVACHLHLLIGSGIRFDINGR